MYGLIAPFFFSTEYYFIVWMHHSLLTYSPIQGYLCCFQVLPIMNKGAVNIRAQVFCVCEHKSSTPLSAVAGYELRVCLVLWKTSKLASEVAVPLCTPTSSKWEILLLHSLTGIRCRFPRILAPLIGMWLYLIVVLICISLMTYDVEHLFICLFAICVSSLMRYNRIWTFSRFRSLAHFKIWLFFFFLFTFKCSWYILDNSYPSDVSF